jgi:gas vesicle protein
MSLLKLISLDRMLSRVGLERRSRAGDFLWPALGVFSAGVVVGGALGLLLAPSSGTELRQRIGQRVRGTAEQARRKKEEMADRLRV